MVGVVSREGAVLAVKEEVRPAIVIDQHKYAVLLNMDVSESMKGRKWNCVCEFVDKMMECLGDDDLVSGLVFNESVRLLQKIPQNDRLFTKPKQNDVQQVVIYIPRNP